MDCLSYSDTAVLLSLHRRISAPDCALRAVVFLPYRNAAHSGPPRVNKQAAPLNNHDFGRVGSVDGAHVPWKVIITHYLIGIRLMMILSSTGPC